MSASTGQSISLLDLAQAAERFHSLVRPQMLTFDAAILSDSSGFGSKFQKPQAAIGAVLPDILRSTSNSPGVSSGETPLDAVASPSRSSSNLASLTAESSNAGRDPLSEGLADEVDPQIIEALKGKDRIFVLKLGEMFDLLISERRDRVDLTPATSYQRLLVHRCAAYYKLQPENDPQSKNGIIVNITTGSSTPIRKFADLVPAIDAVGPSFKIMRRSLAAKKPRSHASSVAGDDGETSENDPSEEGSSSSGRKKHKTIEEREAAYNAARTRIFQDFQEKETASEKHLSAGSSSQSLASSNSTSGGARSSSIDDIDDSISTVATESEWSGSVGRKDHSFGPVSDGSGSSNRSLRSNAPTFNVTGSSHPLDTSSNNGAFSYPNVYEPPSPGMLYDPSQPQQPYHYPYYNPAGQGMATMAAATHPFPYYPYPYPYPNGALPPPPPLPPVQGREYYPPSTNLPPVPYGVYGWPQQQSMGSTGPVPQNLPQTTLSPQPAPFYPPYMNGMNPYPPYHIPAYYQQPVQSPYSNASHPGSRSPSVASNTSSRNGLGDQRNHSTGHLTSNAGQRRGAPPARHAWSYGPGPQVPYNPNENGAGGHRLTTNPRRQSNVSNESGRQRTGDEASSTAVRSYPPGTDLTTQSPHQSSSTTSSSSRRTYTSTSSHHPLPPRPDWAVGLKPGAGLLSPHAGSLRGSPGRSNNNKSLHPTDFPPLSTAPPNHEKRTPAVSGAWLNPPSTRSILMPNASALNNSIGVATSAGDETSFSVEAALLKSTSSSALEPTASSAETDQSVSLPTLETPVMNAERLAKEVESMSLTASGESA